MSDTTENTEGPTPEKRAALEESLSRGRTLMRLDARRPGVRVPEQFAGEVGLALNLSWRFPDANLVVNDRGFAATLRFGGTPFRCVVPWSAVWGLVANGSELLHVWPASLPSELGGPVGAPDTLPEPPPVEPMRPRLSVVGEPGPAPEPAAVTTPAETPEPAAAPTGEGEPTPPTPRPPWLRVVK